MNATSPARDGPLLVLGRDDALARGHDEDLVRRVGVELVPGAVAKGVFVQVEVTRLVADDRLGVHRAEEDVAGVPDALLGGQPFDAHGSRLAAAGRRSAKRVRPAPEERTRSAGSCHH